ncbi:MAG TPA: phage tail sheath C-terminal domain-containing protein [Terriglobia bacterium]|nr:phage tail sheath C-terminal domain-containing protein [Terriglobia bacterium]
MAGEPNLPGRYIEESAGNPHTIQGVPTVVTAFVGYTATGPLNIATHVTSFAAYERIFGGLEPENETADAVRLFYANGGQQACVVRVAGASGGPPDASPIIGERDSKTGIYALDSADLINLLVIPRTGMLSNEDAAVVITAAIKYCQERRAFYLIDPIASNDFSAVADWVAQLPATSDAALYFPQVLIRDPFNRKDLKAVSPSGAVAGVYARFDAQHGVWKAPAGTEAALLGVERPALSLTDQEVEMLTSQNVNALREFPGRAGTVVWGARTRSDDDYKYVPVRRLALFLEASIERGLEWVVFEPNGEALWANIRTAAQDFLLDLFRKGALLGRKPDEAFFVKCDRTTMTQNDIDQGLVKVVVGFAPLRPAEFLVLQIQRQASRA